MNTASAEHTLIFFVCLYWVFFTCTCIRLALALFDVFYRKITKWTHAKTIHATIVAALLARAIHLTLLHFVDEGKNLFLSALDEDLLFKILGSIPGHILISVYSLLGLLWLSLLGKTYDVSTLLIAKRFSLFGRSYDASSTSILKQHLTVFCATFNFFLYCSWIIFFFPNVEAKKRYCLQDRGSVHIYHCSITGMHLWWVLVEGLFSLSTTQRHFIGREIAHIQKGCMASNHMHYRVHPQVTLRSPQCLYSHHVYHLLHVQHHHLHLPRDHPLPHHTLSRWGEEG